MSENKSTDANVAENEEGNVEVSEISREFQENVVKYVKIDDMMKKKQKEIAELRNQRKTCEEFIIKYLDQINESVIEISNGKLRKSKSETKVPLNVEIIKDAIMVKVKNPTIVNEIMTNMDKMRPKKERVTLKRTAFRSKK